MSESFAKALIGGEVEKIHAHLNAGEKVHSVGGKSVQSLDSYLTYPLLLAVKSGSPPAVSTLLERGADVNWAAPNVVSALHAATGNYPILRMLLDAGADPNKTGARTLNTAIHEQREIPVIAALLDAGIQTDGFRGLRRDIITNAVTHAKGRALVKYLMSRGFDIDSLDFQGNTALHLAAKKNNPLAIDMLVSLGASLDTYDAEGQPLHAAVQQGRGQAVEALLRHGASIFSRSAAGLCLLEYSVLHGQHKIALNLLNDPRLANGADLDHLLILAARSRGDDMDKVVNELLQRGADPHVVDENGRSLLQITRSTEVKRLVRAARTANKLESAMSSDDEPNPSFQDFGGMQPL